ncbi:MAG: cytochrome C oxidase subunit IV family protein [Planctomycetota bacterium]|nr:cytochrome C oxidase subunit IV family protein [Planctomycetota bacterium]
MSDNHEFDANKIFIILIIATALEVAWGWWMPGPNWWVWGGLISMALYKGLLILQYFMHFKFEGWIVKGLMVPTPILIMVVVFALMPDVAKNSRMDHGLTEMADPDGEILDMVELQHVKQGRAGHTDGDGGH